MRSAERRNETSAAQTQFLKAVYADFGLKFPVIPEKPATHYPIVVIIGPPGAGKTTAAEILGSRFGCQVFHEKPQKNPFLSRSYKRNDPEVALKSQAFFLLLKFQSCMEALVAAARNPVIIEPSIETDTFYALTFRELRKITKKQYLRYLEIYKAMADFLYRGDIAVSIVPTLEELWQRIQKRGRDYESGFTGDFLEKMLGLCRQEEGRWGNRCLAAGNLNFLDGSGKTIFIRDFGLKVAAVFSAEETPILCPDEWGKFRAGNRPLSDDCRFKKE